MKLFDKVKKLLEDKPELRSSDKKLIWEVVSKGIVITYVDYMMAPSSESITRARRKVQELYPHLQATKQVREGREKKEKNYPSFVFREGQTSFFEK